MRGKYPWDRMSCYLNWENKTHGSERCVELSTYNCFYSALPSAFGTNVRLLRTRYLVAWGNGIILFDEIDVRNVCILGSL